MQPRSPPKPKKVSKEKGKARGRNASDEDSDAEIIVAPKKRSPRRAAKVPSKYVEISSEGDWNGDDDDSFVVN